MRGLFCDGIKAKNNEEYRVLLKKRQKRMWGLFAVGLLTAALGALLGTLMRGQITERQAGFILGVGTGLSLGSVIEIWILQRKMGSEERLREVDEREIEVRSRALQATAKLLLAFIYVLMIIGCLFDEEIVGVCILLAGIFMLSFQLFQKYYGKKL